MASGPNVPEDKERDFLIRSGYPIPAELSNPKKLQRIHDKYLSPSLPAQDITPLLPALSRPHIHIGLSGICVTPPQTYPDRFDAYTEYLSLHNPRFVRKIWEVLRCLRLAPVPVFLSFDFKIKSPFDALIKDSHFLFESVLMRALLETNSSGSFRLRHLGIEESDLAALIDRPYIAKAFAMNSDLVSLKLIGTFTQDTPRLLNHLPYLTHLNLSRMRFSPRLAGFFTQYIFNNRTLIYVQPPGFKAPDFLPTATTVCHWRDECICDFFFNLLDNNTSLKSQCLLDILLSCLINEKKRTVKSVGS